MVVAGKMATVDCNHHWFTGNLTKKVAQGWGFNYYEITGISGPMTTLRGCVDDTKRQAFVKVNFADSLIRYNSKLPIVVYLPKGYQLKYHIWKRSQRARVATPE